jgi:hypothetical protein
MVKSNVLSKQGHNRTWTETDCRKRKALDDKSIDPTGVVRNGTGNSNSNSLMDYQVYTDSIITQTLESYVLPLLPTVPLKSTIYILSVK